MLGKILGLIFILMLGWFLYSQILGTDTERAQGKALAGKTKDLAKEIAGIFQHEIDREKSTGTYSAALGKLGDALKNLNELANKPGNNDYKTQIAELQAKREALEKKMKEAESFKSTLRNTQENPELKKNEEEIKKLAEEIEKLAGEMEKNISKK